MHFNRADKRSDSTEPIHRVIHYDVWIFEEVKRIRKKNMNRDEPAVINRSQISHTSQLEIHLLTMIECSSPWYVHGSYWIKSSSDHIGCLCSLFQLLDTFVRRCAHIDQWNEYFACLVGSLCFFAPLSLLICCRQWCAHQILWHPASLLRFTLRRSVCLWVPSYYDFNSSLSLTLATEQSWQKEKQHDQIPLISTQASLSSRLKSLNNVSGKSTLLFLKIPGSFWSCSRFFVFVIFFRNHSHAAEALIIANNGFYRCVHCMHIKSIQ